MTQRQWQEVFTVVRREQKQCIADGDTERYNHLGEILDELYPIAYQGQHVPH